MPVCMPRGGVKSGGRNYRPGIQDKQRQSKFTPHISVPACMLSTCLTGISALEAGVKSSTCSISGHVGISIGGNPSRILVSLQPPHCFNQQPKGDGFLYLEKVPAFKFPNSQMQPSAEEFEREFSKGNCPDLWCVTGRAISTYRMSHLWELFHRLALKFRAWIRKLICHSFGFWLLLWQHSWLYDTKWLVYPNCELGFSSPLCLPPAAC